MKTTVSIIVAMILLSGLSSSCKKSEDGDTNKPFIILNPPNPIYWAKDLPYVDPGAKAYDITEAGDTINITDRLDITSNVDVSAVGDYNVFFNVSDEAGNKADQRTRDVKVVIAK